MNTMSIAKAITRTLVPLIFIAVFAFSLLFAPDISWPVIAFSAAKGTLAAMFGGIFLLILSDTLVRSIAYSATETHSTRKEGGFIYHFLKPDPGEIPEENSGKGKKRAKASA